MSEFFAIESQRASQQLLAKSMDCDFEAAPPVKNASLMQSFSDACFFS
uniref:SAM-dependent methyltransferase n=1 Tax=Ascaris lumbricoides TaxID=6252 RepID=A0A0M3HUL8_ASCLU